MTHRALVIGVSMLAFAARATAQTPGPTATTDPGAGAFEDKNLGQVISRYNHTAKTTSTPTIVTTASGRSAVVAGGHGRSSKTAGVAPMDGRSTFSRSLTDPGGHGSAHGDAVSHGRGSSHGGGTAAGRDR